MAIEIRPITDIEADWPLLWPLRDALNEHHLRLIDLPLRPDRESRTRAGMLKRQETRPELRLLALDGGEAIGTSTASIIQGGPFGTERIGHLGDFYVRPERRGSTLVLQMHRIAEQWLREHGVTLVQRGTLVKNERAHALWQRLGYLPFIHMMQVEVDRLNAPDNAVEVRRVTDLDAEWQVLRPMIEENACRTAARSGFKAPADIETRVRSKLEQLLQHNGRVLIARMEGRDAGFAAIQPVSNPWLFVEKRGMLHYLHVTEESDTRRVSAAVLGGARTWMERKGIDRVQGDVLASDEQTTRVWAELGFVPYFTQLQKQL